MTERNAKMKRIGWACLFLLTISTFFSFHALCKQEEYVTVHMTLSLPDHNMEDFDEVMSAINDRLRETLHLQLQIDNVSYEDSNIMKYLLKNPHADLICVSNIKQKTERGMLLPLDGLLEEEGKDILSALSEEYLDLGKIDDVQYSLIRQIDMAQSIGICMRKDLVEKYGIDVEAIHTWEDYEAVLETVMKGENSSSRETPFYGVVADTLIPFDTLSNTVGVLMSDEIPMKVVNYYETSEFREWITRIKNWREAGYLYDKQDFRYRKISARSFLYELMKEGMLFSYIVKYKPGISVQESKLCERDLVSVNMGTAVMTTDTASRTQWGIYSGSNHPKEAMQVLNLLYHDEEIVNLICWGIEGKHYQKNEDGTISYPDGKKESEIGYHLTTKWQLPDPYLAYVWEGDDLDLGEKVKNFNDCALSSPALGFLFDSSSVNVQCNQTDQIIQAYLSGFICGIFDVDTMLPKMIEDLKENGSEEIIAQKQRQLDEWYAQKNPKN